MRDPKLKDWIVLFLVSGLIGGFLGMFFGVTSWQFWAIDIPILFWINWFFLFRDPQEKTVKCTHMLCKNEPVEDDDYCEVHQI